MCYGRTKVANKSGIYTRDLLRSSKKYLVLLVLHSTKSFPIVGFNNTHPTQLDPTIGKFCPARSIDLKWYGISRYFLLKQNKSLYTNMNGDMHIILSLIKWRFLYCVDYLRHQSISNLLVRTAICIKCKLRCLEWLTKRFSMCIFLRANNEIYTRKDLKLAY